MKGKNNFPEETGGLRLEDGFGLLDELLGYLTQTDEWCAACSHNAAVQDTMEELHQRLEQLREIAGAAYLVKLENVLTSHIAALNDAAILYGFRTALKLSYAIGRPTEMSQYLARSSAAV